MFYEIKNKINIYFIFIFHPLNLYFKNKQNEFKKIIRISLCFICQNSLFFYHRKDFTFLNTKYCDKVRQFLYIISVIPTQDIVTK